MRLRWAAVLAVAGLLATIVALSTACTSCSAHANFVITWPEFEDLKFNVRIQLAGGTFAFACPGEMKLPGNVTAHCSPQSIVVGGPDLDIDTDSAILTIERSDQTFRAQDLPVEFGPVVRDNPDGCPGKGGCCSRYAKVP